MCRGRELCKRGAALRVDAEDAAAASKAVVAGAVDDTADADLAKSARAHDAWLDRHVQRHVPERRRCQGKDTVERDELGVEGGLRSEPEASSGQATAAVAWQRPTELTFRHSFVRLRAAAITWPSRTKTQPTGTSLAARASSACETEAAEVSSVTWPGVCLTGETHLIESETHERQVLRALLFERDEDRATCGRDGAGHGARSDGGLGRC